jgi:hypothetical protein
MVRKFQNEYMKSPNCPKYERRKILPTDTIGQHFSNFFVRVLGNAMTSYVYFEIS